MNQQIPIERHFLYGEPAREVEPRFMHVEPIRLRSGQHDWTIAPHAHADLHQILFVTAGGGTMRVEGTPFAIEPPALLFVPSHAIHAFDFAPTTDGWVITVAAALVAEISRGETLIGMLLKRAHCRNALDRSACETLAQAFTALSQEFVWSAPARMLAIEAELIRILVAAGRLVDHGSRDAAATSADTELMERFRHLIERDFRRPQAVASYARKLFVTEDRLLAACQRRFGEPPQKLIHRRIMVEAQRWLIYTHMPVGEIGKELGFRDAAYFSRFFKARTGQTPRDFRERHLGMLREDEGADDGHAS